jgi:hypothetical protein
MEESGRLAALQLELDTKAAAVRQLRDELASKDEEMEFLREELHTKTEELEEVRKCYFCCFGWYCLSSMERFTALKRTFKRKNSKYNSTHWLFS